LTDDRPLAGLLDALRETVAPVRGDFASRNTASRNTAARVIASRGAFPALVALASEGAHTTLAITATGREAEELATALGAYLDPGSIALFPSWETLPHERLSPRADTVARRLTTLRRLATPGAEPRIVVAPLRAAIQPMAPGLGAIEPVELRVGERRDLTEVTAALTRAAYARVDMVERRGEFAVRGGIVDVFAPTDPHPTRVEFFGDEVESIRQFSVSDQRSLGESDRLVAPACREMLLTDEVRARAAALAGTSASARDLFARVAGGIAVEGMESLLPVLVDGLVTIIDELPRGSRVISLEPERLERRAEDLTKTADEFLHAAWSAATAGAPAPLGVEAGSFRALDDVRDSAVARGIDWASVGPFGGAEALATGIVEPFERATSPEGAIEAMRAQLGEGWTVVIAVAGQGSAERLAEKCGEAELAARVQGRYEPVPGVVSIVPGVMHDGFSAPGALLLVLGERDLTGRAGVAPVRGKTPARRRASVDPIQLRPGDYVVHERHGIGRFVELVTRTVRGVEREYIVIEYSPSRKGMPGDRLSVPTDHLDRVTKYVGGEAPSLSKMGGADWAKTKGRARRAIREIAAELIRLYSARMATKGHAFGPDTPWQRELEEAFPYVETPDQLSSIDEVKEDMEREVPMDRLICGDVGFGKTEIAVRAAFKAIQGGTQVALLVPTTLLVRQHADTFAERFAPFPVKVAALSRFQTDKEARAVEEGLADGTIDLVIGTHRLITGQVRFKNLGLVIIDEEQRFGVEHKETLKAMRTSVDVLSMSATPIPRTLEMAVTGIRELSTLATPPEERLPILTYVGPHEDAQIIAAIRRELLRDGQVFYIHNTVRSIDSAAARLRDLVPEARIGIAHGQMSEHQLESVIVDYYEKRYDVLVCTTIVETGLDIPNANTLVVEKADAFGLSQLHQLRGRVGRGRERAYAYFLYQADRTLTELAHDRLQTIAAHTDLGSGTAVAMKDLEIRGAGNLLGAEQSGHIEGVGFDLYMRMVGEAVASFRGDGPEEAEEVTIDLPIDAHLPADYIPHERLRLEAYRKIADAPDEAALASVQEELADRYGSLPEAARNLFAVAVLRCELVRRGVTTAAAQGKYVRFGPLDLPDSAALRVRRLFPGTILKPAVRQILVPTPVAAGGGAPVSGLAALDWVRTVLDAALGAVTMAP
jgi:transcription-repair coupling factor (superfamily II helicase)